MWLRRMVHGWCDDISLQGRFGSHTLRKSWEYMQRTKYSVGLEPLQKAFGHSSSGITLAHMSIQPEEMRAVYLNEIGA